MMCESWWLTGTWGEVRGKDEAKQPIQIEPLGQGFLVMLDIWGVLRPPKLAFTDRVDVAGWLLEWLGFEEEIVEGVLDILEGLWDADELYNILSDCVAEVDYDELVARAVSWNDPEQRKPLEYERALDVASAAWVYIEQVQAGRGKMKGKGIDYPLYWDDKEQGGRSDAYDKLVETVKKWRGVGDEGLMDGEDHVESSEVHWYPELSPD